MLFGSVFRQAQKGVQGVSPGRASTASKPVGLFRFLFGHKKERLPGRPVLGVVHPAPGRTGPTVPNGPSERQPFSRRPPASKPGSTPRFRGKPLRRRQKNPPFGALQKPKNPLPPGCFEFSTFSTVFSTINMSFPHSKLKRKVYKNFPEFLHNPIRKTQHPFFRITIGNSQVFHGFHIPYYYYCISINVYGRLTP